MTPPRSRRVTPPRLRNYLTGTWWRPFLAVPTKVAAMYASGCAGKTQSTLHGRPRKWWRKAMWARTSNTLAGTLFCSKHLGKRANYCCFTKPASTSRTGWAIFFAARMAAKHGESLSNSLDTHPLTAIRIPISVPSRTNRFSWATVS